MSHIYNMPLSFVNKVVIGCVVIVIIAIVVLVVVLTNNNTPVYQYYGLLEFPDKDRSMALICMTRGRQHDYWRLL